MEQRWTVETASSINGVHGRTRNRAKHLQTYQKSRQTNKRSSRNNDLNTLSRLC